MHPNPRNPRVPPPQPPPSQQQVRAHLTALAQQIAAATPSRKAIAPVVPAEVDEVQELKRLLRARDEALLAKDEKLRAKDEALLAKDVKLRAKDEALRAKDEEIEKLRERGVN